MDPLDDSSDDLSLDEFAKFAVIDLAQNRQGLVDLGVELEPNVLALESHQSEFPDTLPAVYRPSGCYFAINLAQEEIGALELHPWRNAPG